MLNLSHLSHLSLVSLVSVVLVTIIAAVISQTTVAALLPSAAASPGCSLSRARFEELCMDYFRNSMGPVEKCLKDRSQMGVSKA